MALKRRAYSFDVELGRAIDGKTNAVPFAQIQETGKQDELATLLMGLSSNMIAFKRVQSRHVIRKAHGENLAARVV